LQDTYADSSELDFLTGIEYLTTSYSAHRSIRGDGNCYYRALLFSYLESLLALYSSNKEAAQVELDRLVSLIDQSVTFLESAGYAPVLFDTFTAMFTDLLKELFEITQESLIEKFNDSESDYYVWYCRLLTAGSLRTDAERFLHFLPDMVDMKEYTAREVEPMGKDVDHVNVVALCEHLQIRVHIEYLNGRPFDSKIGLNPVSCGPDEDPRRPYVTLLYRPGHYEILYP
jgi:ubiquitin thioesterase protein OTUB1